jgi:1,4-dihydroxy-2-naphthoyl-CoA hydrolase
MPESGSDSSREDSFREFKSDFDANPYHKVLGITVLERRPGYGKIALKKDENTPGGIGGSVHGGVLAAMVDIVMLVALFAEMREGEQPAGTAELSITYLRQTHGEHIYAEANVVKRGRQLSLVEIDITDDDGRLCARGRTLYAFRAG